MEDAPYSNQHVVLETISVGISVTTIGAVLLENLTEGGVLGVAAALAYDGLTKLHAREQASRQQG